jgi:hypothetical protein
MAQFIISTYLRTAIDGKMKTWLQQGSGQPVDNCGGWKSREEMVSELTARNEGYHMVEPIPNGIRITPKPGCGTGYAYQELTFID